MRHPSTLLLYVGREIPVGYVDDKAIGVPWRPWRLMPLRPTTQRHLRTPAGFGYVAEDNVRAASPRYRLNMIPKELYA